MKKRYYILLFFASLFCSCETVQNENTPIKTNHKFVVKPFSQFYGVIEKDGSDYYVFKDFQSFKKIYIYKEDGVLFKEIDLKGLSDKLGGRYLMEMHSLDSIFFITEKNTLVLIDSSLNVLQTNQLWNKPSFFHEGNIGHSFALQGFVTNGDYYFGCYPKSYPGSTGLVGEEYLKCRFSKVYSYPFFMKYNNGEFNKGKMFLEGYYKDFLTENDIIAETKKVAVHDSIAIVFSWYNDTITKLNLNTDKVTKIKLSSRYSECCVPPDALSECFKSGSNKLRVYGMIDRVYYMKDVEKYCVSFLHHTNNNEEGGLPRHFSIAIYDKGFNKISELKYDANIYYNTVKVSSNAYFLSKQMSNVLGKEKDFIIEKTVIEN